MNFIYLVNSHTIWQKSIKNFKQRQHIFRRGHIFLLTNRSTGFDRRQNIEYPKTHER